MTQGSYPTHYKVLCEQMSIINTHAGSRCASLCIAIQKQMRPQPSNYDPPPVPSADSLTLHCSCLLGPLVLYQPMTFLNCPSINMEDRLLCPDSLHLLASALLLSCLKSKGALYWAHMDITRDSAGHMCSYCQVTTVASAKYTTLS